MKTVILMRHGEAQWDAELPQALYPLSLDGVMAANRLFKAPVFEPVTQVWASTYRRAYETAMIFNDGVTLDSRLDERAVGQAESGEFWAKQYADHDLKNPGGESMNEVSLRMKGFVDSLLGRMSDGETALAVSHAAAICAYLMGFCEIAVLDENEKIRRVTFRGQEVLSGKIKTPSAFVLGFENGEIKEIRYLEQT